MNKVNKLTFTKKKSRFVISKFVKLIDELVIKREVVNCYQLSQWLNKNNIYFRFSGQLTNYCNKMRSIFVIALLLFVTTTFAQDDAAAAAPAEERAHDIEPRILNLRILISFSRKWVFSFWKSWKLSFFIKLNHYFGFLKF